MPPLQRVRAVRHRVALALLRWVNGPDYGLQPLAPPRTAAQPSTHCGWCQCELVKGRCPSGPSHDDPEDEFEDPAYDTDDVRDPVPKYEPRPPPFAASPETEMESRRLPGPPRAGPSSQGADEFLATVRLGDTARTYGLPAWGRLTRVGEIKAQFASETYTQLALTGAGLDAYIHGVKVTNPFATPADCGLPSGGVIEVYLKPELCPALPGYPEDEAADSDSDPDSRAGALFRIAGGFAPTKSERSCEED